MAAHRHREVEVKLQVASAAALRRRLAALGARRLGRVHDADTLYDTPQRHLFRHRQLLRLRRRGQYGLLTYKGPTAAGGRYKVREEIEARIPNPARLQAILEALGLRPWFRYEKYRTSYRIPRLPRLAVELDETPIGVFVELEGPRKAIDHAASLLGYAPSAYLTASYFGLYQRVCRKRGLRPGHMLFARLKK